MGQAVAEGGPPPRPVWPTADVSLYVSASLGVDGGPCTAAAPCATLAFAIRLAGTVVPSSALVQVIAAPGEYGPSSCSSSSTRPLALLGSGQDTTFVDCGSTTRFLSSNVSLAVAGLTLRNGRLPGGSGGGISIDWHGDGNSVLFDSVTFVNHSAPHGDGGAVALITSLSLTNAQASFFNCTFRSNYAKYYGAAVAFYLSSTFMVNISFTFQQCSFYSNTAGAIHCFLGITTLLVCHHGTVLVAQATARAGSTPGSAAATQLTMCPCSWMVARL